MKYKGRGIVAAVVAAGLVLAGCSSGTTNAASSSTGTVSAASSSAAPAPTVASGQIIVFAAASLKNTFTTIGETFKTENPGASIAFSFAGSSDLVTNLTNGAPADVFASADVANMTKAADLVSGTPVNFATNILTIVTPPDNPAGVTSFADLAKAGVSVVVCAPKVPCGAAEQKIEASTGVTLTPVSQEQSVTDVLNKVISGEADAGLVYLTDAAGAGAKVTAIPFPESSSAVNTYPIAVLKSSTEAALAQKFVDLVTGPEGQAVLKTAGFAAAS